MYAQNPDIDAVIARFKKSLAEDFYDQLSANCLKSECTENDSFLTQTTRRFKKRIAINLAQSRCSLLREFNLQDVLLEFFDACDLKRCMLTRFRHSGLGRARREGEDSPDQRPDESTTPRIGCERTRSRRALAIITQCRAQTAPDEQSHQQLNQ